MKSAKNRYLNMVRNAPSVGKHNPKLIDILFTAFVSVGRINAINNRFSHREESTQQILYPNLYMEKHITNMALTILNVPSISCCNEKTALK